mmetsp:Transcript_16991/g.40930  ORF Transcript_16991/g.40930 Transcript_16991/m.40930 type:complete len:223 (+) Transcript_16991:143-811(+)
MTRLLVLVGITATAGAGLTLLQKVERIAQVGAAPGIPKISQDQCDDLQKAMFNDPPPRCKKANLASNMVSCMCTIQEPPHRFPAPDALYDPFFVPIPPDPNFPPPPPAPTVPPPADPTVPFNAPVTPPTCPYSRDCPEGDFACVNFKSWGFSSVKMASYTPASAFFNTINCFYMLEAWDKFKVPAKVSSYWEVKEEAAAAAAKKAEEEEARKKAEEEAKKLR